MSEIVGWETEDVGADALLASNLPQNFAASVKGSLATGTSTLTINVLRNLRPDRFIIPAAAGPGVSISDIKIGTTTLNASSGDFPGEGFGPLAVGTSMRCTVTATPSLAIYVTLNNHSGAAITNFSVGVVGPSADPTV